MANIKISQLTETTSPIAADSVPFYDSTVAATRRMTIANLGKGLTIDNISDVTITSATSNDLLTWNGTAWVNSALNIVNDTTPQLGGNIDWNSKAFILSGVSVSGLSTNQVAYFDGTNWVPADASAASTCSKMLGIYLGSNQILTHGIYTTSALTAGSIYYVSETTGAFTTTAPTTSLSIVRILGYALSTTELFVFPDSTYVENA